MAIDRCCPHQRPTIMQAATARAFPASTLVGLAPNELIVDSFAGGGGASQGMEQALGRPIDIASRTLPHVHFQMRPDPRRAVHQIRRMEHLQRKHGSFKEALSRDVY